MQDMNTVISKYKKGKISLFEASELANMHPKEFLEVLVKENKVKAVCSF